MLALARRLTRDNSGQDLLEYALLVALVAFAGMTAWTIFQGRLGQAYQNYDTRTQDLWRPPDPAPTSP